MTGTATGWGILDRFSARIRQIASGRTILAALAGLLAAAILVNGRPFGIAELEAITGGAGVLDMRVLYTPDQAYAHLAAMGAAGRAFDLTHIVPVDLLVPFFYALFLSTAIAWLLQRWLPEGSGWHRLNVVPVIGACFDYLENAGIVMMLLAWPTELPLVAGLTMVSTLIKFAFSALAFGIVFLALAGWVACIAGGRSRQETCPANPDTEDS